MSNAVPFILSIIILSLIATIMIGLYGIVGRPNLVKKLIALTILGDTTNLLVILLGYRSIYPVMPPILPDLSKEALSQLISTAVDPLPQALVITAVVIGMAVNVLLAFAIIQIYRLYGTVDTRELQQELLGGGER
ncbi:Na+/H+ antiporter subunit C [Thermococcus sp. GR7]|uniref:sodium:proton antiporter n=1 Tax=unclassified Thermococcus TaxID=2627626 RepID=UPI001431E8AE|nr:MULTISPECIES: sodium:proton antiporter [unclassified Thermococcus]NJE47819.1 Na+/H+ antiporter subunit C [Thermococcus sp. GR7]NJE79555.1 Na+/H+ antiporter subunit C [Thermococcus sp. GR4]NJF23420.1 Na+/H+ antiporter subunit C [Thermococcus sp. GR5]